MHISVLETMLKNNIYIGWIEWGEVKIKDGKHEWLIDEDMFEKVKLVLSAHNKQANRKRKHSFLLRGLAWCQECGSRIQAGYSKGKMGVTYGLYGCQKRQHGRKVECSQSAMSIDTLESQFTQLFKPLELTQRASDKVHDKVRNHFGQKHKAYEQMRRGLLTRIDNIKASKKNAFLKYVSKDEHIDTATYEEVVKDLETEEAQLNDKMAKLEGDMGLIMRALEIGVALTENVHMAYSKAPTELKSVLAQAFFKKILIKDKKISVAEIKVPMDFICHSKVKNVSEFKLAYQGDPYPL